MDIKDLNIDTITGMVAKTEDVMINLATIVSNAISGGKLDQSNWDPVLKDTDTIRSNNKLLLKKMNEGTSDVPPVPQSNCVPTNIYGYAWSDNIGWIDMCGVSYDLDPNNINNSTPAGLSSLSGYAWSSNVGWIQFGGLADFPSNSGGVKKNAQIDLVSGNNLSGWAKVLALEGSGDTELATDWADGWISLSGKASDGSLYGPVCDVNHGGGSSGGSDPTGFCTGAAWGSNAIGWVDFSEVVFTVLPIPTVSIMANGILGQATVSPGGSATIDWSGNNLSSCIASGAWSGVKLSSGSYDTSALSQGVHTYNIACTSSYGLTGGSANGVVSVNATLVCNNNGIQDNGETGIDCGGGGCDACIAPPPTTDICPNIDGIQTVVPNRMVIDSFGNCVLFRIPYFKEN
jgi:hypothetical protein